MSYNVNDKKNVPLSQYAKLIKPSHFPAITLMLIGSNHKDDQFLLNVSFKINLLIGNTGK